MDLLFESVYNDRGRYSVPLSLATLSVLVVYYVFSGAKAALGDGANQYSYIAYLTILYFCVGAIVAGYLYGTFLGTLSACLAGLFLTNRWLYTR